MLSKNDYLQHRRLAKQSGFNYRMRRHPEWTENYTLYRDRVLINRLTQRQSVNIPIMKYSLNTLRKDIDDAPLLYFHNLDNDAQREVFYNESFKYYMTGAKAVIKDIHDKNNAMLFGRTFKKLNIINGRFDFDIVDPQDMNIERYVDPANLDSARHLIHEHIYVPLATLKANPLLDKKEVKALGIYFATEQGLIRSGENARDYVDKQQRMAEMGVFDQFNPVLGETFIELNEDFMYDEDPDDPTEEVLYYAIVAEDQFVLYRAPLSELLGDLEDEYWDDHFPYTSWGVDPDATDFWCDGVADILRMPNKVVNTWFSQEVENRTLRSFGMNYYDATHKAFVPQTFQPVPWGFYGVPGDPNKILKSVFPEQLNSNMDGINFLMQVAEKASAATTTQQGQTQNNVTLGDIKLALSAATERVKSMAVFYNDSWQEFGHKYVKMMEGASHLLDDISITKQGKNSTKQYPKLISPKDWATKGGYRVEIKTVTDKTQESIESIQKLQATAQFFQNNEKFSEILKRKAAEFAGLNAEEIQQVMETEKKNQENIAKIMAQEQNAPSPTGQPTMMPPTAGGGNPSLPMPQPTNQPIMA